MPDETEDVKFFDGVSVSLRQLQDKVHKLAHYLDTSSILANIQTTKHHLQTLQMALELGLLQEPELDDILDMIKDFLDFLNDWLDKVSDYLERIIDDIWDWIKDMPLEDLERLFKFLHFWIHNVEVPCDGSMTIIICGVEYHIYDLIQCCIMG